MQGLQSLPFGPLIEVAKYYRAICFSQCIDDGRQLRPSVASEQAQVRCNDRKRQARVDRHLNCTSRLQTRQIDVPNRGNFDVPTDKNCIAMPTDADFIGRRRHNFVVGFAFNQLPWQRGWSLPKPVVGFLQDDDISTDLVNHTNCAATVVDLVQPSGLANVVTRNPKGAGFFAILHARYISTLALAFRDGTPLQLSDQTKLALGTALVLGVMAIAALWLGRWSIAFVCLATFGLSLVPVLVANRLSISLPVPYLMATTAFLFASIVLGEAFGFYEKVWWWDLALHGSSAIGFGLFGFLFVFMLFDGDRFAAPPFAIAFISFCVAVTVGSLWELFEFAADGLFGFSMQKSGLVDSMTDIILNTLGAAFAGVSGYLYLVGRSNTGLGPYIDSFVRLNRKLYRRSRDRFRR